MVHRELLKRKHAYVYGTKSAKDQCNSMPRLIQVLIEWLDCCDYTGQLVDWGLTARHFGINTGYIMPGKLEDVYFE